MLHATRSIPILLVLLLVLPLGCTPEPKAIRYGEAVCTHCKMGISDARFGAELVTDKGKVYVFDAIECLAAYLNDPHFDEALVHSLWVTDFDTPGTLINVTDARFVHSATIQSPMGGNLAAFADDASAMLQQVATDGQRLDWPSVRALVANRGHEHGMEHGARSVGSHMGR